MNPQPCIVHVGMYKTGTTSIQTTLGHRLRDPRFHFVTRDATRGNLAFGAAFLSQAAELPLFRNHRLSGRRLERFKHARLQDLASALQQARLARATPILSAEVGWRLTPEDAQRLNHFLRDHGFQARILACLRAPHDFVSSLFQEIVKAGTGDWRTIPRMIHPHLDYRDRIEMFDGVFGREQVEAYLFEPARFPGRCVVQDFCQRVGIDMDPVTVSRVNDSLNANAVKLLYSFNRCHPRRAGVWDRMLRTAILRRLQAVTGPRLRITPDIARESMERLSTQRPWLEQRLGRPLPWSMEDTTGDANRPETLTIQTEDDLFRFDPSSLQWLANQTGKPAPIASTGEDTANQVAAQMRQLYRWPQPTVAARFAKDLLRGWMRG